MTRRFGFVILFWTCCFFHAANARADAESDLLNKFRTLNKSAADKLRQEAGGLISAASSPGLAPLRKLLGQLQDDMHLPRAEREILIRKLQDRLHEDAKLSGESLVTPSVSERPRRGPHGSGFASASDPNVKVKQGTFVAVNPGRILVPDGGAAVLGGFSYGAETRNEYGVPGLGGIPYLGRAFRNVGTSRISGAFHMSVSVRVISMQEEEDRLLGR